MEFFIKVLNQIEIADGMFTSDSIIEFLCIHKNLKRYKQITIISYQDVQKRTQNMIMKLNIINKKMTVFIIVQIILMLHLKEQWKMKLHNMNMTIQSMKLKDVMNLLEILHKMILNVMEIIVNQLILNVLLKKKLMNGQSINKHFSKFLFLRLTIKM